MELIKVDLLMLKPAPDQDIYHRETGLALINMDATKWP
jgi:hypothetical protein